MLEVENNHFKHKGKIIEIEFLKSEKKENIEKVISLDNLI